MTEPASPSSETPIDDLVARLKSRVEERRAAGEYPDGLEAELEAHFQRIVFHRTKTPIDDLQADIDALDSHMVFTVDHVGVDSDVPGGEIIHRALNKALHRTHQSIMDQVQEFAEATRRALRTLSSAMQDPSAHSHRDIEGHLDGVLERMNAYERTPVDSAAAIADLRRRVEELEGAEMSRQFRPFFTNIAFEEHFRDPEHDGLAGHGYEDLAADVPDSPVIDFGCGRGEFLEIMRKRKIDAWGIEIDPVLAKHAIEKGLRVETGDGLQILAAQQDESIGAIIMLQVIEHLNIQQQIEFVSLAFRKLKPGGRVILETVNPQSLYNLAHAFYIDPTHTRPVHPAYLSFVFEQAGFREVKWQWRNPPPAQDVLEKDPSEQDSVYNRNVERLNRLLFDAMDYALIVTK